MDDQIRNQIDSFVRDVRNLLEKDISEQLEGVYGLHKDGTLEDLSSLPQIKDDPKAKQAREGFVYFITNEVSQKQSKQEAIRHLVLSLSFTHLNRLIALKLMERRKVIPESISRGTNSNGFKFFLGDFPEQDALKNSGKIEEAYKNYLLYQFQNISEEIHSLFDPADVSTLVFPKFKTLRDVLDLINQDSLNDIWTEDETIGWIYQYFTPKERRKKMREENPTPKNSHELAVRNQFYTPRYVVRFLSDNTLGRIWYEMRRGETRLADFSEFMVRRPHEVFLSEGQEPPADPEKETEDPEKILNKPHYIPFRAKKDPREIRILDPAVGSGHFLLYSYDLLRIIYEEAYNDADLGGALKKEYPDPDAFKKAVPALILRHNLHGIDIDPRAVQIASLALWLRAQRDFQELGIKRTERPKITKSNIVCAEPMPGDLRMLSEFKAQVKPAVLGNLVEEVWQKMQLAGEAGSLLKIEQEISRSVKEAKEAWLTRPKEVQQDLFGQRKLSEQYRFDFRGIKEEMFWDEAEERLLESLRDYAKQASDGQRYSRTLFAEDAAQGFAFIDLMQKQYDVVLMNPPFGETTENTKGKFQTLYPDWNKNYLCAFIDRAQQLINEKGSVGVIFDRTALVKSTYENFRGNIVLGQNSLYCIGDTGWEVLDANVETTTMVLHRNCQKIPNNSIFFDIREIKTDEKSKILLKLVESTKNGEKVSDVYFVIPEEFKKLPNSVIGYDMPEFVRKFFFAFDPLENTFGHAKQGHAIKMDEFSRFFWEINHKFINDLEKNWVFAFNGGEFSYFYLSSQLIVSWKNNAYRLRNHKSTRWSNAGFQFTEGIGYGKRGEFIDAQILRKDHIFTVEGSAIFPEIDKWLLLSVLNSSLTQYVLNKYCGQHKYPGYLNLLPIPRTIIDEQFGALKSAAMKGYFIKANWYHHDETDYQFLLPWALDLIVPDSDNSINKKLSALIDYEKQKDDDLDNLTKKIDETTLSLYGGDKKADIEIINKSIKNRLKDVLWKETRNYSENQKKIYHIEALLSFYVGAIFGRWDIVNGGFYDEKFIQNGKVLDLRETIQKKFKNLQENCILISDPIKFLLSPEELQKCKFIEYPPIINSDGIIVLDEGNPKDIIKQISKTISFSFKESNIENVQLEIEEILGMPIRKYFEKSFFKSHCSRYLERPIYWQLSSNKGNYSIWLYYHRITKDTLFQVLKYVEDKINLENSGFEGLKQRKENEKDTLSRSQLTKLGREIEAKADFISELKDFKEKIEKIAKRGYDPDFDDGVILNMAPLHEVIPWKEPKAYWEDLEKGKYDWAHIAMKYWPDRVREKCRKDKSIAIAHGLEHLYEAD